jgi:hypothetical protein
MLSNVSHFLLISSSSLFPLLCITLNLIDYWFCDILVTDLKRLFFSTLSKYFGLCLVFCVDVQCYSFAFASESNDFAWETVKL